MKKIVTLFILASAVSFSARKVEKAPVKTSGDVVAKFNALEASYAKLVETENAEFARLRATAERASAQLDQKQQMKAKIEERSAKIEGAANAKYFKEQYSSLVKEYNNVVKALDQEINALSKTVDNYNTILQLKEGSGQ